MGFFNAAKAGETFLQPLHGYVGNYENLKAKVVVQIHNNCIKNVEIFNVRRGWEIE